MLFIYLLNIAPKITWKDLLSKVADLLGKGVVDFFKTHSILVVSEFSAYRNSSDAVIRELNTWFLGMFFSMCFFNVYCCRRRSRISRFIAR